MTIIFFVIPCEYFFIPENLWPLTYTSELLVYMVGQGSSSKYALNEWEQVSCEKMDVLLKALSSKRIIIIADFQGACEYLNALTRDNLVKISNTTFLSNKF